MIPVSITFLATSSPTSIILEGHRILYSIYYYLYNNTVSFTRTECGTVTEHITAKTCIFGLKKERLKITKANS